MKDIVKAWLKVTYYLYAWCYVLKKATIIPYEICKLYRIWYKHFWKEFEKVIKEIEVGL